MKRFIAAMTAVIMLLALACTPALALSVRDAALDAALNVPDGNIQFVTEGEYPWTVDGANGWAKSTNFQVSSSESTVTATVTAEEGDIVSFDYKVSSEARYDKLVFSIDGNPVASSPWTFFSGEIDWTNVSYALTAGEHVLSWSYQKDSSSNNHDDTAYLDNVYVGAPAAPESLELTPSLTVQTQRRAQLNWTVLPENAYNKEVTFASADESIAVVDANGLVTGVSVGQTVITATTVDGGITAECAVTVEQGPAAVTLNGFFSSKWYSFIDADPAAASELPYTMTANVTAAEFAGGYVYGYMTKDYFILNPETGEVTYPAMNTGDVTIRDMAYDHSAQKMYAIGTGAASGKFLYTVDISTGAVTEIAQIVCGSETPMTLAISTDGTAYVLTESYSNASKLYSIDLQTGVGTLIGSTGFGHKRFQSMAYDHNTNQLFWARFSDYGNGGLAVIDTATGAATDLGMINGSAVLVCGLYIANNLPVGSVIGDECTVTFVDGMSDETISTATVDKGSVLTAADFPTVPAHEGYAFTGWDYNGAAVNANIIVTANYFDITKASVTLRVIDEVYLDGSGFQMLLDADAVEYGVGIPETGNVLAYGAEGAEELYSRFEYKLPENADGNFMTETDIVFNGESVTVSIPAGTYDWCIANPRYWHDDGPQIGLVSDIGTAHGRNDDYVFEAGKSYVFTVYRYGELGAVDVEITDYNSQPGTAGDVDGNGVVETADALLALRGAMGIAALTPEQVERADMDGNGVVDTVDALAILRRAILNG